MKRIQIMEDDAAIRAELKTLLQANGYITVEDGPCDLVLMDVNLPGESGFTLCRKLRQASSTPVIFLTARDTPEDELLAFGVGGDDFIRKPYHSSVLLMTEISRSAIGAVEQALLDKQDYCDYVEQWVHEMKTPLTACTLILSNDAEPAKLRRELRRADNLTESILTYAKLRTAEKDTQISLADLRTACDQAVREEMELLIAAGIAVSIRGDGRVFTDPKLLVFSSSSFSSTVPNTAPTAGFK